VRYLAFMRCHGEVERLDEGLASLARAEAGMRLRLGQVLEVLGRGQHFELGFSSVAAYALERCDRSVRWVEGARSLARRLEPLRELRRALAFGSISWSMAELLARVARPADEASWMEAAQSRTVRQMRGRVLRAVAASERDEPALRSEALAIEGAETTESDEVCTLTCTVDQEEAWLFEATRALLERLGVLGADAQVEALLAEGQETLLAALPEGWLEFERLERLDATQRSGSSELGRWRAQVEACCEQHLRKTLAVGGLGEPKRAVPVRDGVAHAAALGLAALEGMSAHALDSVLRELSRSLSRHELELSRLVLQFHRADGWRRLGYASEAQYARERLGMSRSSFVARRALALRLEKLPRVAEALGAGQIGVEAAVQVVRVAVPVTEVAWVERAQQRTIKHLREEVAAALVAVRLSGEANCPPPMDAEMDSFHELEQGVVSGRVCQAQPANDGQLKRDRGVRWVGPTSASRRAWQAMLGSLAEWLEGGLQMSAARAQAPASNVASKGRIELRLRVSRANHAWWRGLEAQARGWLPSGTSWLRFLCLSIWNAWQHLLGASVAYGRIYIRDRYRCSSPVCNRRDVTPHHLQFRSAGGSDDDDNVTALCTWCHLFGVHGGRIRAAGSAQRIHWELGAADCPCLVVDGRERVAA
jgi:HAMP domain-containing protein